MPWVRRLVTGFDAGPRHVTFWSTKWQCGSFFTDYFGISPSIWSRQKQNIFLFYKITGLELGHKAFSWMSTGGSFHGYKPAGVRGWSLSAEVKNKWSYISNSLHAFTACTATNLPLLYRLAVSIITPMLYRHLHLNITFVKRLGWRSLGTIKRSHVLLHIAEHWREKFSLAVLFLLRWEFTNREQSATGDRKNLSRIHYLCTKTCACRLTLYIARTHVLLRNVECVNGQDSSKKVAVRRHIINSPRRSLNIMPYTHNGRSSLKYEWAQP